MQSTTNVQRVTITRGELSLISDHDCLNVHFGPSLSRRDVGSQHRDDVSLTLLWNIAT